MSYYCSSPTSINEIYALDCTAKLTNQPNLDKGWHSIQGLDHIPPKIDYDELFSDSEAHVVSHEAGQYPGFLGMFK